MGFPGTKPPVPGRRYLQLSNKGFWVGAPELVVLLKPSAGGRLLGPDVAVRAEVHEQWLRHDQIIPDNGASAR